MGTASVVSDDVATRLQEWWRPLLGPDGLCPPPAAEMPDGVSCNDNGFAQRYADLRKDALAALANVGPMTRGDFAILGIETPADLAVTDGSELYVRLQRLTGLSIDPCQHDIMLAVVAQAQGEAPKKWWAFTSKRKAKPDLRLPKMLGRG